MARWVVSLVTLTLLAPGCRVAATTDGTGTGTSSDGGSLARGPRRITVPADVIAAARIRTEPPTRDRLDAILEFPGEIAADPDRVASIASPVAGRITTVTARLGAVVRKGDVLFTVRVPELSRLRAEVASKQAMGRTSRLNADRIGSLYAQHAASEKDAQQARSEAEAVDAQARSANEVLIALGTTPGVDVANSELTLRAPISGVVTARNAVVGQPVTAEQVIATIGDSRELWFLMRVYESNLARVHVGETVEVVFNAYPEARFPGSIAYVGEQLDPTTRAVSARVVLANRDGLLRIGLFGVARVRTDTADGRPPALVVPAAAVVQLDGHSTLFVRAGEGAFEVREVEVGAGAVGKVEITRGVRDGEAVVVDGAFTLKSVALRGSLGDGD